ncbi:MAG: hypothetical protein AAGC70_02400 [Pseudomonadota bacterium]
MTPFHIAISLAETMTKACLTAQTEWAAAMTSVATRRLEPSVAATPFSLTTPKPAASWYRAPAPTWTEVAQSYGWPTPSPLMMAPMMSPLMMGWGMPTTSPVGNPLAPLSQMLNLQIQLLQTMVAPLHAQFAASGSDDKARSTSYPLTFGASVSKPAPSDDEDAASNVAVASITLPDQTTFKITLPLAPASQPFWPWAGPFGASSYATPPATIEHESKSGTQSRTESSTKSCAVSQQPPEKALNETLRRSFLKSSRS